MPLSLYGKEYKINVMKYWLQTFSVTLYQEQKEYLI
jgi:hypothetical protein